MEQPQPNRKPTEYYSEVVLYDGRTAAIVRPLTQKIVAASYNSLNNPWLTTTAIAAQLVEIDGKPINLGDLLEMESLYAAPIMNMVNDYINRVGPFVRGIG